jgi:ribonuclease BN (tRNA processing enzyme)
MELVVLGSGTAVPHPERGSAGYLVRQGGYTFLVDTGLGTLHKLAVLGISLAEPDAVVYTHLHLDHTAELAPMLFALKNTGIGRRRPLVLYGAPGLGDFFGRLCRAYGRWVEPPFDFPFSVEEGVVERGAALGPLEMTAFPVLHTPQSVALRIEDPAGGRVLAFSGDSDVCEGLAAAVRGADVVECSCPEGRKVEGHLTPGEAGRIASRAGVRRLVLTHFYPECDGEDVAGQCRKEFGGEIILAADLMRLEL